MSSDASTPFNVAVHTRYQITGPIRFALVMISFNFDGSLVCVPPTSFYVPFQVTVDPVGDNVDPFVIHAHDQTVYASL